ncbi:MAG: 16S rRNA (adenine(1518)-N(6)/adenine(1519)-N(6))-dimethyltransferase RsmA [Clostridiales bacterium]|nr:16S rRNA (adenine(1518)-N(6)/adenine(1519)-N(6))-dimethyltransferase RsmA [Clostridiales bacterium]
MDLSNINTIKTLLSNHGIRLSKSLGQNFLTAPWVPKRIVEASMVDDETGVLEIGPGIGVLTRQLAEKAGKVVAVEIDKKLIPLLEETLMGCENVIIINDNILKINISALMSEALKGFEPVVCANLPYNITTPILTALIESGCFKRITVMVQKEVAGRICSEPGTAEYGSFTVYINYHCEPEILFNVSPDCFIPRPKVTSSVITLITKEKPDFVENEKLFFQVVRAAFAQRRKTLVNSLFSVFGSKLEKTMLVEIIKACGFNENIRGEILGISEFAAISNKIGKALDRD